MFITAKLVFENYIPDELLPDMWFKQRVKDVIYGKIYEYDKIFKLSTLGQLSPQDFDSIVQMHGYPVKPMIMSFTANPDEEAILLAHPEQIGWWDDEPWDTDEDAEMRDIELKDINMILSDYDGEIEIEVDIHEDEYGEEIVSSALYEDKVRLSFPGIHHDEDDYDEDTPPDDREKPDDYEDMDWEDDEPEEDSAGYTTDDRCPKYDSDHETE